MDIKIIINEKYKIKVEMVKIKIKVEMEWYIYKMWLHLVVLNVWIYLGPCEVGIFDVTAAFDVNPAFVFGMRFCATTLSYFNSEFIFTDVIVIIGLIPSSPATISIL